MTEPAQSDKDCERIVDLLVKHGLVDPAARDDPEGYDHGQTLAFAREFAAALAPLGKPANAAGQERVELPLGTFQCSHCQWTKNEHQRADCKIAGCPHNKVPAAPSGGPPPSSYFCRNRCFAVTEEERCVDCPSRLSQAQPSGGPTPETDKMLALVQEHHGDCDIRKMVPVNHARDLERRLSDYKEKYLLLSAQHVREVEQLERELADALAAATVKESLRVQAGGSATTQWVPISKVEAQRLIRENEGIQLMWGNVPFIRQRKMGTEWFRFDAPPLPAELFAIAPAVQQEKP